MYSAEEYARCLRTVSGMTELERKKIFSTISYPSDSYLLGELISLVPADKFVEAVKRYENTSMQKVTWVKVEDELPDDYQLCWVTLYFKPDSDPDSEEIPPMYTVEPAYFVDHNFSKESGIWRLCGGEQYIHYKNDPLSHSNDTTYSHVVAWSRETPRFHVEPFKP